MTAGVGSIYIRRLRRKQEEERQKKIAVELKIEADRVKLLKKWRR